MPPATISATVEAGDAEGIGQVLCSQCAGVAELVDARDLKSLVPHGTCRFDSGPPHQVAEVIEDRKGMANCRSLLTEGLVTIWVKVAASTEWYDWGAAWDAKRVFRTLRSFTLS